MQAAAAVRRPRLFPPSLGRAAQHRRASSTVRAALHQEFRRVVTDRDFPYRSLRLLASERSAGKSMAFSHREFTVEDLAAPGAFDGVYIALSSAGGSVIRKYGPAAVSSGAAVVDNSSAFRMDPEVPLVIPEVNPEAMANVRLGQGAIVANPNCSTIICFLAATPLHRHAKVSDKDDVAVGRIWQDLSLDDNRGVGGGTVVTVKTHAYSISPTYGARLCLDSGATHHMVSDPSILSNIRGAPAGLTVITADGSRLRITKVGDIELPDFRISDVWLVPGLKVDLISVHQLTGSGATILFTQGHARLFLGLDLVGVANTEKNTGLYILGHLRMPIHTPPLEDANNSINIAAS